MKNVAIKELQGGYDESYGKLPTQCEIIKLTNLDSAVHIAWKEIVREKDNVIGKALMFSRIFN